MEIIGVLVFVLLLAALLLVLSIKSLLIICQPSEVVIFSGPKRRRGSKVGYRYIRGGRGLRIPLLERVDRMDLTTMAVDVAVKGGYSRDGVPINVEGVANIKIDGDPPGLDNAVERLMGKTQAEIMRLAKQTLEGNLRGVLARLTPEEVNEDKEKFATELIEEAEVDLATLGLMLDTLKIQTVTDEVEYLNAMGRARNAELIRNARIAEAERKAESLVQEADNLQRTRISELKAARGIAAAEARKRIVNAKTRRAADVAREEAEIAAQVARSEAAIEVQRARIEQVKLQLEADLVEPARAYKAEKEAGARASVAQIIEDGRATAAGLEELAQTWTRAGDQAREIFLLEKLRTLIGIMVGTVGEVHVDRLTMVGEGDTTAASVASLLEQLRSGGNVDVPALLQRLGLGKQEIAELDIE